MEAWLRKIFGYSSDEEDFDGFGINDLINVEHEIDIIQAENDREHRDVECGWSRSDTPPMNMSFCGNPGLKCNLLEDPNEPLA